jgi:hypothetical protein
MKQENSQLMEYKQIEGTPFTLIRKENEYFVVMGNHRVTEGYDSEVEALNSIVNDKWLTILKMILIVNDRSKELDRENNSADQIAD